MPHTPRKPTYRRGLAAPLAAAPQPAAGHGPKLLVLVGMAMLAALLYAGATSGAKPAVALPPPQVDMAASSQHATATAVFAGGCFWGVQAVFQHTRGVLNAVSGYAGGTRETAHYPQVSSGKTGHAEEIGRASCRERV